MKFRLPNISIMLTFCLLSTHLQGANVNSTTQQSTQIKTANYGTWESPISTEKVAAGTNTILNMIVDGDTTYWCEMRPANKGRYTIVKCDASGKTQDMTAPDFNVRTFVHEYGGAPFAVSNGVIYASNAADHAIYVIKLGEAPKRLTQGQTKIDEPGIPHWKGTRFADLQVAKQGLVAVGETHAPNQPVENFLALISTSTGDFTKLTSGYDFYSSPAISPDQKQIAWISWNNPNMPWTDTELWIADFTDQGTIKNPKKIAGEIPEAIFQPQWSPEGILYFVTDRDHGWWNIHRYADKKIENVGRIEAEVGGPLWVFGRSTYAFLGSKIVFSYNQDGVWHLGILDPQTQKWQPIPRPSNNINQVRAGNGFVQFLEGYPNKEEALVQIDATAGYPVKTIYSKPPIFDDGYISQPKHIAYPSSGRTAYGFYYPPQNKDYKAPAGEKPPLVVMIHGGPTAQTTASFSLNKQFWTSRGFAVLDVNYGGSTGYGREYRHLLDLNWGIVDVQDCINGATWLAQQGLVDMNRLVIRGGSAGGYTTLAALAFSNTFKAGASYYGVADIEALARDTHKFEARYEELLVGKYPEEKHIWQERSPINSVDKIQSPLILFQGEDDTIVPKNQSIMIYEALKRRGIPTELHIYPGEEHGFRQAQNIIDSLNRELGFYQKVFGLTKS